MNQGKSSPSAVNLATASELYRLILKIRLAERKIIEIYPSDKIQSPVHLSIGQEAVSVGICRGLRPADHVFGTYRGHGLYIAKGGELNRMFAELYGKETGCSKGKGGSMHLTSPETGLMGCSAIVGSTIPVAAGDALASQMKGRPYVVAAVFGDGGVDEGVFFETVNFAVLKKLPLLFICENNGYAIHSKVSDRHGQPKLFKIGSGLGLAGKRFDGNDVFTVTAAVRAAAEAVRKGGAPILLEFTTHRWQEHVGPGSDLDEYYRERGEKGRSHKSDPLAIARATLKRRWRVADADFKLWESQIREEVEAAVAFAEKSPFPGPEQLYTDLYA